MESRNPGLRLPFAFRSKFLGCPAKRARISLNELDATWRQKLRPDACWLQKQCNFASSFSDCGTLLTVGLEQLQPFVVSRPDLRQEFCLSITVEHQLRFRTSVPGVVMTIITALPST